MKLEYILSLKFFGDLRSNFARKRIFWFFGVLLIFCILFLCFSEKIFDDGILKSSIQGIFINVLSTVIIILISYFFYLNFIGISDEMVVLRSQDINIEIDKLSKDTNKYYFWGRSGSYFRSYSLLKIDEFAEINKTHVDVIVILPDPFEQHNVSAYRAIRQSLKETNDENDLKKYISAMIIVCSIINANNKFVNIKLFLSKFLPIYRIDISDHGCIVTQDDPLKSALYFDRKSEFYNMFLNSILTEADNLRPYQLNKEFFQNKELKNIDFNEKLINVIFPDVNKIDKNILDDVKEIIASKITRYKK